MKFQSRRDFGWPGTRANYAPCNRGLVVHYDSNDQGLARKKHSACVDYWKWCRNFHMNSRDWLDIGYSFAVCPHGYVMEGRGWQRQQAAQPGGNDDWTSCTFMSGPSERPTQDQVNAFKELRHWLMGKGLRSDIKGHRDFYNTSCPGNILYRMVQDGSFKGKPEEDDMPSAEEVATAVWKHKISNQFRKDKNGKPRLIAAEDFLEYSDAHHDAVMARFAAMQAIINQLAKAIAEMAAKSGQVVDADELIQRITDEISGIDVELTATPREDQDEPTS